MMLPKESTITRITFIALFVLVIVLAFKIACSFLIAIIVGALFALVLKPFQRRLTTKRINPTLSAYLVFAILVVTVVVPIGFFIRSLISQAITFKDYVSSSNISYNSISQSIGRWPIIGSLISNPVEVESQIKTWIIELGSWVSTFAMAEASKIPKLLFQTFFVLLSCLFFLLDGEKFIKFLHEKIPLRDDIRSALITSFKKSSRSAIWATLLAAVAQSVVIFLGFIILDIPAVFLAAGATFIFAFIPILGSTPVWIPAVIYLYLQGSVAKFIIMIVFGLIAGVIDNIVRIIILKGRVKDSKGLHPLISLVAVLGGIQVFGLFGVLIGPVIAALLISMLEVWPSVSK
ncbi:MAG: AI-2E family transporter [Proteobacteria bacterium]|nr:AI-2E family transporter [Pseudomonadota bacterium]